MCTPDRYFELEFSLDILPILSCDLYFKPFMHLFLFSRIGCFHRPAFIPGDSVLYFL